MLLTIPRLPARTSFKLDQDEFGQPRLRWNWFGLYWRYLKLVTALIVFAIIYNWDVLGWTSLACVSPILCVIGSIAILVVWEIGPGRRVSLVLTEAWLLYDEGGIAPPGSPLAQWERWRLKDVRLEPRVVRKRGWPNWFSRGRQRLLLDDGGLHHVEIGQTLSDSDRQWLAEVIREWIVPPRDTQLASESEAQITTKPEG